MAKKTGIRRVLGAFEKLSVPHTGLLAAKRQFDLVVPELYGQWLQSLPTSSRPTQTILFPPDLLDRRKRHGERLVHARIRAVYNDVGRSSIPTKQMTAPFSTTSALSSKSRGLQEADIHDEYYRLLDSESELKAALLQEQQKRVKAMSHARRLEEVVAMKDKKIETLLHAKAIGTDRSLSTHRSVGQREMAERDRQLHAMTQKLKQKLAQQSQLLSSYEEAMQSLRSGVKSTNLMELEEERNQLYQELRHHQILLDQQRFEWEAHQQKLVAFSEAEASSKLQIAKLQQENKMIGYEKRKLEQEVGFLKSRVEQLQSNLSLEQRKRTYDREFSESVGKHTFSPPTQKVMLAQALDEMKSFMQRETMASTKREKQKSSKTSQPDTFFSPVTLKTASIAHSTVSTTSSAPTTPIKSTMAPPSPSQLSKNVCTCSQGIATRPTAPTTPNTQPASAIDSISSAAATVTLPEAIVASALKNQEANLESKQQTGRDGIIIDGTNEASVGDVRQGVQEDQVIGATTNDKVIEIDNIKLIQECPHPERQKSSSSEAVPDNGQQCGDVPCNVAEDADSTVQVTDEEMDEIQQQKLASIASVLRLDIDDDADSELSSLDVLDDAQHLRNDPDMNSIDDAADAALINFEVSKEEVADAEAKAAPLIEKGALQEESKDERGQSLDDLYAEDFIDTDA
ncbi:hypothetical protein F441_14402 [Phytophthora nicotianae CJ01A1]|uniref:Lebercilin domain-containing protein n=1 Tax=Phytophthora nicotianae CJ01A1 TaxID=1317063 RepID=W2WI62_PHYNI|nr:hypothetical protein F441_14402 [Phytophthora nicotianae CJ01A1]